GVGGTNTVTLNRSGRKGGRSSGLTFGRVDSISLSVSVDYGDGIGVKTLTNQIGLVPDTTKNPKFGDHGDSGSVVVDDNRKIVGLYFAGGDDGSGVANPIAAVLAALNIDICVAKSFIKDLKDGKREKNEIKEGKREKLEKREKIEIKEFKREKFETKEKLEIIESIPKFPDNDPKGIVEGPQLPGGPSGPGPLALGSLEERLASLEA